MFCSKNLSAIHTSQTVINIDGLDTEDKIKDSICKAETIRADKDIRNKLLTYYYTVAVGYDYKPKNELNILLSHYNIKNDTAYYNCTESIALQNCYSSRMQQEIEQQYGTQFIDSLKNIADVMYVKNRINTVFSFAECDTISRYPNAKSYEEHFENYKKDFFANVPYPKGFQYKNEEHFSYITADFILHKDGHVSDIDVKVTFQNEANNQFLKYYTNKTGDFILGTKWVSATSHGIMVDSEVPLVLFFK